MIYKNKPKKVSRHDIRYNYLYSAKVNNEYRTVKMIGWGEDSAYIVEDLITKHQYSTYTLYYTTHIGVEHLRERGCN